ncbi:MAG TPA: NAD-dependent protein deacetylase [Streptosporangiaceae bacterium]|nr:NAD-dependent protein deacetylase [Streptosporangiaceae bacterium]
MTRLTDGAAGLSRRGLEGERETGHDSFRMLVDLVTNGQVLVLSGAGLSTESGIPDYRGPTGLARRAAKRERQEPMTYQTFVGSAGARRRYWARSYLGWRQVTGARPNPGHHAVAELERRGLLTGIITQNVDGLHQAAGTRHVVELHGSLARVLCLDCGQRTSRLALDRRLREANAGWAEQAARRQAQTRINPDGDAVLSDSQVTGFRLVDCAGCGGVLKPDVVFFGENVPRPRVEECFALVERAGSLVVLGSSLTVMSGYRFVRQAARLGVPVAIVNLGPTRGDQHAAALIDAPLGLTLTELVSRC